MEVPREVPDLLNIFTKIVCDKQEYCFVCLRTTDERRLVKPESLKKFMVATKITSFASGTAHLVCHICERQAANALKLFRAAIFASSLSLILKELRSRDIKCNKIMLETKYFQRVLNKVELSKNLTPAAISEEVRVIRNNNFLSETDTLVMDNKQIYEATPTPTVVAITTGQADVNNTEALQQALTQCPSERMLQVQRCGTPSILPDRHVSQEEIRRFKNPPLQETYVILDDEDDPLLTPTTDLDHMPDLSQPVNQNLMATIANLNDNLVITADPPNIIRFEDLLTQQTKQTNFLLHPIFLADDGTLSVPSLSAVINNGLILFQDSAKLVQHSKPLQVNIDIVKQSLKHNQEVFLQNCNTFKLPTVNSNLVNLVVDKGCQSEYPLQPMKKMRTDEGCLESHMGVAKNSLRISDMDEAPLGKAMAVKTDWEDKIPMDVISFVDAVDPHADSSLQSLLGPARGGVQLRDVRSLARDHSADGDVIDLC